MRASSSQPYTMPDFWVPGAGLNGRASAWTSFLIGDNSSYLYALGFLTEFELFSKLSFPASEAIGGKNIDLSAEDLTGCVSGPSESANGAANCPGELCLE